MITIMRTHRGAYVPPICPIKPAADFEDLREHPFELVIGEMRSTQITEIFGVFGPPDGYTNNVVETTAIEVPSDSPLADKARLIAYGTTEILRPHIDDTKGQDVVATRQIGEALCKRVLECQGVQNGECWALGPSAVKAILEEVTPDV